MREQGATLQVIDVDALSFDLRYHDRADATQALEPDLLELETQVERAAHIAVSSPVWWGSVPASFKGAIDRVFLPGWAYRVPDAGLPQGGLGGRSGRVLLTMDAPGWWDGWLYGRSASRQLRNAWLRYCGVDAHRTLRFTSISHRSKEQREGMLDRARAAGRKDGVRLVRRFGAGRDDVPLLTAEE